MWLVGILVALFVGGTIVSALLAKFLFIVSIIMFALALIGIGDITYAQAKRIQADAEAYYNAQVASSLTPEMVQLKQVEKWDGKLPTYSGITNGLFNLK